MATSLRPTPDLTKKIEQLAKRHRRSAHSEMLYGIECYIRDCTRENVEKIVSSWFSLMQNGSFGDITPQTLYETIQEHSMHPDKDFVTLEDCSYVDQTDIDEQIRKHGAITL